MTVDSSVNNRSKATREACHWRDWQMKRCKRVREGVGSEVGVRLILQVS